MDVLVGGAYALPRLVAMPPPPSTSGGHNITTVVVAQEPTDFHAFLPQGHVFFKKKKKVSPRGFF